MAAYEKGLVTQRDGRVLQTQFRVSRPDGLIGLRWVPASSRAIYQWWLGGYCHHQAPKSAKRGTEKL